MTLALLLDENISPTIARHVTESRPDIRITSVHEWRGSSFKAKPDEDILAAAADDGLTLVTYDQKTIIPLLVRWGHESRRHAGVIFIDNRTVAPSDFGTLVRALIEIWEMRQDADWTDKVEYIRRG